MLQLRFGILISNPNDSEENPLHGSRSRADSDGARAFERAFSRRLLVRLIGVRYSSLVSGNYQLGLFGDTINYPSLYNALDRIRLKYGDRSVIKAIGLEAKTMVGESFQWRATNFISQS